MRKLWIIIILGAIFGGTVFFEIWRYVQYPIIEYSPVSLSSLPIGVEQEYDYFKEGERVGAYVFWVDEWEMYKVEKAYIIRSRTVVEHGSTGIELEAVYIFNENLVPIEYRLNVTLGEDRQVITCLFDGWNVNASLVMGDIVVNEPLELPEGTVLVDNFMLGHWDLFFKSFQPVSGKRFKFTAYIPQRLNYRVLELLADRKQRTLNLNGVDYECQVVRSPELNLVFYLSEGNLIQMEEIEQNIIISLTS